MSIKRVHIPFKPHLVLFLKKEFPWNEKGELLIMQRIPRPHSLNGSDYKKFFRNPHLDKLWIPALTSNSRLYTLYYFKNWVDAEFSNRLVSYVALRYELMPVAEAIRGFLKLYEISESDYSWENAYKKWQRSVIYQQLKESKYECNQRRTG